VVSTRCPNNGQPKRIKSSLRPPHAVETPRARFPLTPVLGLVITHIFRGVGRDRLIAMARLPSQPTRQGWQPVAGGSFQGAQWGGTTTGSQRTVPLHPEGMPDRRPGDCGGWVAAVWHALRGASSCNAAFRWSFPPLDLERPPYSFSGLIHRLGWDLPTASPAQPVNKSVRAAETVAILGPAPVRISTTARSTSCSRSPRPEPVTRTRIRILRCRHSTSCTIRTAPRAHRQTIRQ
jgi:hypothetical protein